MFGGVDVFFFQAEDGIRDLVRSRGLGDVYKRQGHGGLCADACRVPGVRRQRSHPVGVDEPDLGPVAVSYTHLTLPTSDLV